MGKPYICRKIKMLSFLAKVGITPFASRPDRDVPGRFVWLFNDTEELRLAIQKYYST